MPKPQLSFPFRAVLRSSAINTVPSSIATRVRLCCPRSVVENYQNGLFQKTIGEHVTRELLHYFTGEHSTGVNYEDQP
jgi:hypothetical protein